MSALRNWWMRGPGPAVAGTLPGNGPRPRLDGGPGGGGGPWGDTVGGARFLGLARPGAVVLRRRVGLPRPPGHLLRSREPPQHLVPPQRALVDAAHSSVAGPVQRVPPEQLLALPRAAPTGPGGHHAPGLAPVPARRCRCVGGHRRRRCARLPGGRRRGPELGLPDHLCRLRALRARRLRPARTTGPSAARPPPGRPRLRCPAGQPHVLDGGRRHGRPRGQRPRPTH